MIDDTIAAHPLGDEDRVLEGKYRVGEILGVGGMGTVYKATHVMLDKTVAVKVLLADFATNEEISRRMIQEARAASSTGHPNIISVTDIGHTSKGALFVVMEYLRGDTLAQRIERSGPLPLPDAINVMSQVLKGLHEVHKKGIIHRDLKPENIMLVPNDDEFLVKILDFGISKVAADNDTNLSLTQTGSILGTPQYMAPEQARGVKEIDHRVDIYAAGALFYKALTGQPVVAGENYNQVIVGILEGKYRSVREHRSDLPPAIDSLLQKALAKEPEDRFADALAFRKALGECVQTLGEPALLSRVSSIGAPVAPPTGAPAVAYDFDFEDLNEESLVTLDGVAESTTAVQQAETLTVPSVDSSPQAASADASGQQRVAGSAIPIAGVAGSAVPIAAAKSPVGGGLSPAATTETLARNETPPAKNAFAPQVSGSGSDLELDLGGFGRRTQSMPVIEPNPHVGDPGPPGTADFVGSGQRSAQSPLSGVDTRAQARQVAASIWERQEVKFGAIGAGLIAVALIIATALGAFDDEVVEKAPELTQIVNVQIETVPKATILTLDGVPVKALPIKLPQSDSGTYALQASAQGYATQTFQIKADRDQAYLIELEKK